METVWAWGRLRTSRGPAVCSHWSSSKYPSGCSFQRHGRDHSARGPGRGQDSMNEHTGERMAEARPTAAEGKPQTASASC